MIAIRTDEFLRSLLKELLRLPNETEWVEFKQDNTNPEEIGEYILCRAINLVFSQPPPPAGEG